MNVNLKVFVYLYIHIQNIILYLPCIYLYVFLNMKKGFIKKGVTEIVRNVDVATGELVGEVTKEHHYLANSKESFFLCYSAIQGVFMEMEQSEIRVFGYLLQYVDGAKIDITKRLRLEIARKTNLNERTIYNILPSLVEKNLIFKHSDGLYQLNPRYVFKGSTVSRNNALVVALKIKCDL